MAPVSTPNQSTPDPSEEGAGPRATLPAGARPPALWVVVAGIAVEALVLAAAAALVLVELLRGGSLSAGVSIFLVLFAAGVAAVLVASARGLLRGQRWARSPVATWQLLQVVVAFSWLQYQVTPGGIGTMALALTVLVGLMLRPVVVATTRDSVRTDG
ncbi:hypothetical protein H9623_04530 [Oerskovia sp. Sa1BUA8]|uniref:Uncharacterized protein n=1 Tax=Oerskovia douganii TaxID=2762210 RepID=A0A9D5U6T1_9CELL|nr:hypothetical protein [Oerskovia douganii]MBE7699574.1 hypothetical protein [Oerskovia douganii]